jgi:hypothetical protein
MDMSILSKCLFSIALLAGLCIAFSSCSSKTQEFPREYPLRATLSVLETTAAQLQIMATPTSGSLTIAETEKVAAESTTSPMPVEGTALTPAATEPMAQNAPDSSVSQPAPTPACERDDSRMALTASKMNIKVGETVEVKVALRNTGCVSLGLPQYRLAILNSEGNPIFAPDKPEPVVHSLAVAPGKADEAVFSLHAVSGGKATLSAMASFEVHLGYPGPAYWGANSTDELVIWVEP